MWTSGTKRCKHAGAPEQQRYSQFLPQRAREKGHEQQQQLLWAPQAQLMISSIVHRVSDCAMRWPQQEALASDCYSSSSTRSSSSSHTLVLAYGTAIGSCHVCIMRCPVRWQQASAMHFKSQSTAVRSWPCV